MLAEEILDKLEIVPVEKLKIHEQTIPANTRALRETMLNLGRIVDPLIVDKDNFVVLDGNHRRQVLEDLKCENAICQLVDYNSPEIQVKGWYLAVPEKGIAEKYSLGGEKVDMAAGQAAIDSLDACLMLVEKKGGAQECRIFPSSEKKIGAVMHDQNELVSKVPCKWASESNGNGDCILFVEDVRAPLFLEKDYSVFFRRNYRKDEIIKEASAGRPLPPKSTRHIIPNRIIRLNFHLGYLNEPPEVATRLLQEIVRRRVKFASARYYTEPVIVMY